MVYERMLAESRRLETQIDELKKQLKKFPEGKLFYLPAYNELITTYETKEQPLNPEIVEQLIQNYFM